MKKMCATFTKQERPEGKLYCIKFSANKLKALDLPSPFGYGKGSSVEPEVGNMALQHGGLVLGIECGVPNF